MKTYRILFAYFISGDNRKAPPYFAERGLDWYYRILTRPWRYGRLVRIAFFDLHLLAHRLYRGTDAV